MFRITRHFSLVVLSVEGNTLILFIFITICFHSSYKILDYYSNTCCTTTYYYFKLASYMGDCSGSSELLYSKAFIHTEPNQIDFLR